MSANFIDGLTRGALGTAFKPGQNDVQAGQAEIANERVLRADNAKTIVDRLRLADNNSGKYITEDSRVGGDGFTLNLPALLQSDKQLALDLLNSQDRFTTATGRNGGKLNVRVDDVWQDPRTGSYMVQVARPDGGKAPVTVNRTELDDDLVMELSEEQVQSFGTSAFQDQWAKSGADAGFVTGMAVAGKGMDALTTGELREQLFRVSDGLPDEAQRNEFNQALAMMDGAGIRAFAEEMDIDVAGIEQRINAERGIPNQGEVLEESMDEPAGAGAIDDPGQWRMRVQEIEEQIELGAPQALEGYTGKVSHRKFAREDAIAALEAEKAELEDRIAVDSARSINTDHLRREIAEKKAARNSEKALSQSRGRMPQDTEIERLEAQLKLAERADELEAVNAMQQGETMELETGTATAEQLKTHEIRKAIVAGLDIATPEEQASLREYLGLKGVKQISDMADQPFAEVANAARIIASSAPEAQRMNVYQSVINTALTGNPNMGVKDVLAAQADLTGAQADLIQAQGNAAKDMASAQADLRPEDADTSGVEELLTLITDSTANGERYTDPKGQANNVQTLVRRVDDIVRDPNVSQSSKLAAQRKAATGLARYFAARAATSNNTAWWDLAKKFDNWLKPGARIPLGGNEFERVVPIRNADGNVREFLFETGNQGATDTTMSMGMVNELFGADAANMFVKMAEYNEAVRGANNEQPNR